MAVIDELIVRKGTTRYPIDSYDNQMIDEIVYEGNTYHFAKQKDLVGETSINADNAVQEPLVSLKVSGNTVQDGTPTPDTPIPIQNAGDNQLFVSNAVTLNNMNIGGNKLETYEGSKCLYFAIEGGKKYTISLAKCSRFSACTSGAFPRLRTPIYDRADAGALTPSATPTTLVVNATENLRYLIIRYYNSATDTYSEQEILDTLSVEVDKPISVNLLGANLFDIDTVLGTMGTIVDGIRLGWTKQADGSWFCFNIGMIVGERIFTNTGRKQGKLTLLVNQRTHTTGTATGLAYRIRYLDGTDDTLRTPPNTEFQEYSITSNPNKTVDYIFLTYSANYGTYIKYLMINWGDVMPYEPYRKQSLSLPLSVTVDGQEVQLRFAKYKNADYLLIEKGKVKYFAYSTEGDPTKTLSQQLENIPPIEYDLTNTEIGQNLLALATEKGTNILEIKSEIPVSQTELSYWRQIIPNE